MCYDLSVEMCGSSVVLKLCTSSRSICSARVSWRLPLAARMAFATSSSYVIFATFCIPVLPFLFCHVIVNHPVFVKFFTDQVETFIGYNCLKKYLFEMFQQTSNTIKFSIKNNTNFLFDCNLTCIQNFTFLMKGEIILIFFS